MPEVVEKYEKYTGMHVDPRQPYGGELVFAAFSGSHQDAISKGMKWREETDPSRWTVPYLPIDPHDVGRAYDGDVIRINSQSGKGGVAYILEHNFGYAIPKNMMSEVGYMMKDISDKHHEELSPEEIFEAFKAEYINDFSEHAISADSNSKAAAYVCIADEKDNYYWGVGTHADIILASVNALVSALNRMNKRIHFVK